MRITELRMQGFRCFGADEVRLSLRDMTCLIGPNASGKTSALLALQRLFGVSSRERQVVPADFFLSDDERLQDQPTRSIRIEARVEFPELGEEDSDEDQLLDVAATFHQMIVEDVGAAPYVRVELSAEWTDDGTLDGTVEERRCFVATASRHPDEVEKHRHKLSASDRALIRVLYVPAVRDPAREVRATAGTALHFLLRAVNWSDDARDTVAEKLESIQNRLTAEPAMHMIASALQRRWSALYRGRPHAQVGLSPPGASLEDMVKHIRAYFRSGDDAPGQEVLQLCDGLRSLFSLSFTASLLDIEHEILSMDEPEAAGFDLDRVQPPLLTVLCVEEPENHLSPQHLGRVLTELRSIAMRSNGQVLATSHSPSVLRRIDPEEIRFFRGDERAATSVIRELEMPGDQTEAIKYVMGAVRAQTEVYFARLVVLGEGPSEQVVIPRLLTALGVESDVEQIVVVPLGGRHVQYFWRLLKQLQIPYLTLLDLDLARDGGGWERIRGIYSQLQDVGVDESLFFTVADEDGADCTVPEFAVEDVRDWPLDDDFSNCLNNLEELGVYFSSPLDLDLLMLEAFQDVYQGTARTRPRMPTDAEAVTKYLSRASRTVLGDAVTPASLPTGGYTSAQLEMFPWYRSLFLHDSKPATHRLALLALDDDQLVDRSPGVLTRMVEACQRAIAPPTAERGTG